MTRARSAPRATASVAPTPEQVLQLQPQREGESWAEVALGMPLGFLAPLLSCFTTSDASSLRLVSKNFRAHVAAYPWSDIGTSIQEVKRWRACFPRAVGASVRCAPYRKVHEDDTACLEGITRLDAHFAHGVTDSALRRLPALTWLDASEMRWLTGSFLTSLSNLRYLNLHCSSGSGAIRPDAFNTPLPVLEELGLSWCTPLGCTATFEALGRHAPRLTKLRLSHMPIADDWFVHVPGLKVLDISMPVDPRPQWWAAGERPADAGEARPPPYTAALLAPLAFLEELDASGCRYLTDAAFDHFKLANRHPGARGLKKVIISYNKQLTDAAFEGLAGVEELAMSRCDQPTITDAAFVHLAGIKVLNMSWCTQRTITPAAFAAIRDSVTFLDVSGCREGLTPAHLQQLAGSGLKTLDVSYNETLPSAALTSLRGLTSLRAEYCHELDDSALVALAGPLRSANLHQCEGITDAGIQALVGIQDLQVRFCSALTDEAFAPLAGSLRNLNIAFCSGLTDAAFKYFKGIRSLCMDDCKQPTITDAAFVHLEGIYELSMNGCSQSTITDAALKHLSGIHKFSACWRGEADFSAAALEPLRGTWRD